ncbi:MAG: aminopeptidase P family protein [Anaerolineales bacterium]|nr:aminopeptidase P family protein [Anaerolineales bacterium]
MNDYQSIYLDRLTAVRHRLADWQVDGLLITSPHNWRWLSGFTGSNAQLLVTPTAARLATDSRYWEQALAEAPVFDLVQQLRAPGGGDLQMLLQETGARRVGIEAAHVSLLALQRLRRDAPEITWVPLAETLEPLRAIKQPAELALIRAAAAITDEVMAQAPRLARPGMTERALAWELEKVMREAGAEAAAFEIIVAAGPNSARPHHRPGERPLQAGDAIIVDLGAQVAGYKSDLTRTFYLGEEPDARFREVFALVRAAQTAVFTHARAGMTSQAVDALARDVIAAGGHADHFGHGLGHSLGLEIHEDPRLSPHLPQTPIPAGAVITVEPGVYMPGWGGVRIEDLALVTADGFERLSHCPS